MIFLHQQEDIVNVDFHLAYQLGLEDEVIIDIFLVPRFPAAPFVPQVEIMALVILQLPVRQLFTSLVLIECGENVDGFQQASEQCYKPLFRILAHNRLALRKFALELIDQLAVAVAMLAVLVVITVVV